MEVEIHQPEIENTPDSTKQSPKPLEVRRALEDYLEKKRRQGEEEYLFEDN